MISKNRIKSIRLLAHKKYRDEESLFVAEGPKVVGELLKAFPCTYLAATHAWLTTQTLPSADRCDIDEVTEEELQKVSFLKAPQQVLALFRRPDTDDLSSCCPSDHLCLALDGVQDPGNMGTILRISDWFGIRQVICSPDCADAFGPKTVQATMGALARVEVYTTPLVDFLKAQPADMPVYGTFLDGTNIYGEPLEQRGILVMGSEGRGISPEVAACVRHRLFFPSYPPGCDTSESLNVAVATAVTCAEFRRRASSPTVKTL